MENVVYGVKVVENASGINYPPYYVEPVLTVVESQDNLGGIGVLYARTVPVDATGKVSIVVELSAPLILFGTKTFLKIILAHELLHYVELVKSFTRMDIASQITSSSIFEEQYQGCIEGCRSCKGIQGKKTRLSAQEKRSRRLYR